MEHADGFRETRSLSLTFTSPYDFNTKLGDWVNEVNQRKHRRRGCRLIDHGAADRSAMVKPPPIDPIVDWRLSTQPLPSPRIQRMLGVSQRDGPQDIRADPYQVVIACATTKLGQHQCHWASHQSINDPAPAAMAAQLRRSRRLAAVPVLDTSVENRDLADYEGLFSPSPRRDRLIATEPRSMVPQCRLRNRLSGESSQGIVRLAQSTGLPNVL
ncbi:hypothetical protein [Nocardia vinacea]|uniref:hypothetical protein n=1 Tax=Nocardia vinacea TaxID=96468 RepID=UPI0012F68298|nr:hypothetical protein [Nocardia vinacea]